MHIIGHRVVRCLLLTTGLENTSTRCARVDAVEALFVVIAVIFGLDAGHVSTIITMMLDVKPVSNVRTVHYPFD